MKREEIIQLYDDEYASSYEEEFLLSALTKSDSQYEIELLRSLLRPGTNWLDVACGTGYFLRQFPGIDRAGIDLSPAMLRRARDSNPGVFFAEHDFCEPFQHGRTDGAWCPACGTLTGWSIPFAT